MKGALPAGGLSSISAIVHSEKNASVVLSADFQLHSVSAVHGYIIPRDTSRSLSHESRVRCDTPIVDDAYVPASVLKLFATRLSLLLGVGYPKSFCAVMSVSLGYSCQLHKPGLDREGLCYKLAV